MAAWDKKPKKISSRLLQQEPAAILVILLYSLFTVSPVYANMIEPPSVNSPADPVPIIRDIFSEKNIPFSYPLTKKFYNDSEDVAIQTLILEAVGEGYQGMVAVGEVIRNRSRLFAKDFETVCLMPKQFSCWNDRARAEEFLKEHQTYYVLALAAWRESEKSELTKGATDYHATSIHPYWADDYQVATQIGNHIFYLRPLAPALTT